MPRRGCPLTRWFWQKRTIRRCTMLLLLRREKATGKRVEDSSHELLTGHPAHAPHVIVRLLEGVRRRCGDHGAVRRMPLLVLFLALRPVCFASPICGEVPALGLVHVVVIKAPLHKDVLTPRAELPVATLVGARGEDSMTVLQVCCQNRGRGAAHHPM